MIGPDEYHEPVDDNAYHERALLAGISVRQRRSTASTSRSGRTGWRSPRRSSTASTGQWHLRAVQRVLRARAAHHRGDRSTTADRRRPSARCRAHGRRAGAEAGGRAHAPPPASRTRSRQARSSRTSTSTSREPRTAARSRLRSHASLLARAGRYRAALEALRIAARMDLDDLTGSTAGGLHLATMGGLWQALAFGFGGIRPRATTWSSIRDCRPSGTRSSSRSASAARRFGCASIGAA